jgi:transposase InsO family protein
MVELLTMLMNQCRKRVKHITSDWGGEYVSEELQKFFCMNGIQWTLSALHVPQQNGCTERLNRTLHEKAQAIHSSACVMIISIYPHFLVYTNVNITFSNIAIIFLICFTFFIVYLGLELYTRTRLILILY